MHEVSIYHAFIDNYAKNSNSLKKDLTLKTASFLLYAYQLGETLEATL